MPAYSGKFDYLDTNGTPIQQGACEISFDRDTCVLTPADGMPLAFDLGDADVFNPGEWDLTLQLYTGKRVHLRQFGQAFGRMCEELLAAWRDRMVRCLLLEDLEEVARFNGIANGVPAEIRIYGSNLAVLPLVGPAFQRRLAEVDSIAFDDSTYAYNLIFGGARLSVGKLAQKTEEFGEKLRKTVSALRRSAAVALHQTFPFLNPDQLQHLVTLAPEGRSVKISALARVDAGLPEALTSKVVDDHLKPYFDSLKTRATAEGVMTGFKFVRPNENGDQNSTDSTDGQEAENASDAQPPLFFWFFFPLAGQDVAAWEAPSGSGRATYFFRAKPPIEESIVRLTRGLALVNFRREPVYLPDASLDQQAEFHRYAIGRRKLPELAELRAAFLGRAVHSSIDAWEHQADEVAGR